MFIVQQATSKKKSIRDALYTMHLLALLKILLKPTMYSVQQVLTVETTKRSKLKDNLARIHREFVGKEGRLVEILSFEVNWSVCTDKRRCCWSNLAYCSPLLNIKGLTHFGESLIRAYLYETFEPLLRRKLIKKKLVRLG